MEKGPHHERVHDLSRLGLGKSETKGLRSALEESATRRSAGERTPRQRNAPVARAVDQVLEELTSRGELKHKVVLGRALVPLDGLDDVRVLELEERVLPKDLLLVVPDAVLGDDLDGDL